MCQNGTLEGLLDGPGPPPFPHLSPTFPPPYTLHTPSLPFPWPSVCHFVTLLGIQGTRKQVRIAGFQRKQFVLTVRRMRVRVPVRSRARWVGLEL